MGATVLGVLLDENDVSILRMAFDVKEKKPTNYLTPKKVEGKDAALEKLMKNDMILKTIVRKNPRYSISSKGAAAYGLLPEEMKKVTGTKKKSSSKKDDIIELKLKIEAIDQKLDKILSILSSAPTNSGNGSTMNADLFEKSLIDEYNKLKMREFLSDGKVWHEQLKRIMMERYNYRDYEYDEMLQHLKQNKIGMISLSQGKDKTWIEIRT